MRLLLFVAGTYAIFVLHAALARDLAIIGIAPHLILAGLAVMTARVSCSQAVLLAGVWGLLADCLSEGRLGPHMTCFTIFAIIQQRSFGRRQSNVPWKLAASSILLGWGVLAGTALWRSLANGRTSDVAAVAIQAVGSAVYTGLVVAGAAFAWQIIFPASPDKAASSSPTVSNNWRMLTE